MDIFCKCVIIDMNITQCRPDFQSKHVRVSNEGTLFVCRNMPGIVDKTVVVINYSLVFSSHLSIALI